MAKFFLELGVNINARNNMKETLFHVACSSNMDNVNFVKWLMNQNGEINLVNGDGWSGFHYACYNENLKIAKFLVESGVDVNQVTSHGATGVHLLCRKEHPKFELIQYLCNNGYDINLCDAYGDTGLQALNTTLIIQTNTKMQPLEKDRKK
jgi:ankyrin repeat protein